MKLCFIADVRSPISRNWMSYFINRGDDVDIISSYPCAPDVMPGANVHQVAIAFSRFSRIGRDSNSTHKKNRPFLPKLQAISRNNTFSGLFIIMRHWIAPLELHRHIKRVSNLINKLSPDIVHAMRIPFEGILAAKATPLEFPLLISVWGNDFTLHANSNPLVGRQTMQAMERTDALHCDCQRDLNLAENWGFRSSKPATVLPGAGGIQMSLFHPGPYSQKLREQLQIPEKAPVVINPRGFRGYVCNDKFFQALPQVIQVQPKAIFICSEMKENPDAIKWVRQMAIGKSVRLLPSIPRKQMADLFRLAQVTVSPSVHDGTPNTLLEAMACGCFPVAGDIESVREWIQDENNGLLCDPTSPKSIAQAILKALDNTELRQKAKDHNLKLIAERAEYEKVMSQAEDFYKHVIDQHVQSQK